MQTTTIEQTEKLEQSLEAKEPNGEKTEEVSLGKFKDAKSLLLAYNSLQAEFTKRCQKIKELESELTADKAQNKSAPTESQKEESKTEGTNFLDKEEILKDYLKELLNSKQQAIIMDKTGLGLSTPPVKPKTFAEAGKLAQDLLNKKN